MSILSINVIYTRTPPFASVGKGVKHVCVLMILQERHESLLLHIVKQLCMEIIIV